MIRLALLVLAMASAAFSESLTREERTRVTAELEASRKTLMAAIEGLSDAQWNYKQSPGRWSIAECVQHIAAAEDGYFTLIEKMLARPVSPENRQKVSGKDDYVLREMQNRDAKRTAPETLQPGRWHTAAGAVAHFNGSRDRLIRFVQTTSQDLRVHHQEHRAVGLIDAYQWILLASGHVRRHTLQIDEVKKSPEFPKK